MVSGDRNHTTDGTCIARRLLGVTLTKRRLLIALLIGGVIAVNCAISPEIHAWIVIELLYAAAHAFFVGQCTLILELCVSGAPRLAFTLIILACFMGRFARDQVLKPATQRRLLYFLLLIIRLTLLLLFFLRFTNITHLTFFFVPIWLHNCSPWHTLQDLEVILNPDVTLVKIILTASASSHCVPHFFLFYN